MGWKRKPKDLYPNMVSNLKLPKKLPYSKTGFANLLLCDSDEPSKHILANLIISYHSIKVYKNVKRPLEKHCFLMIWLPQSFIYDKLGHFLNL
jgi:hypothetical protein